MRYVAKIHQLEEANDKLVCRIEIYEQEENEKVFFLSLLISFFCSLFFQTRVVIVFVIQMGLFRWGEYV